MSAELFPDGEEEIVVELDLITDRTIDDVLRWKALRDELVQNGINITRLNEWLAPLKGCYSYEDMNRVESVVAYLANRLTEAGCTFYPKVKTDWTQEDIPSRSDMERYYKNVATVRKLLKVYSTTPNAITTKTKLDYKAANDLEQILLDVEELITNIEAAWLGCGDLYSGEV